MSRYIIGVDGGGTKTLGVLYDLEGQEMKRAISGFANFSVNTQETMKHLYEVMDDLIEEINPSDLEIIQIGIAGYSNFTEKEEFIHDLKARYGCEVHLVTDAEIALYSIKKTSNNNVIMVLGGTGSAVMYDIEGKVKLIGGFGHLLGDEGSGYHLAITALKNIINQYEEGREITALTSSILQEIGAANYSEIKNFVYNNKKTEIAKLSEFIAKHALNNDLEAKKLFEDEGKLLAKQALKAYQAMDLKEHVIIGIKGGFLLNAPFVKAALVSELNKSNIIYTLDASSIEPVLGAYYLAKRHLLKR